MMLRSVLFFLLGLVPIAGFSQGLTTSELDARFETISEQETVSRYDLTEFLMLGTCKQCLVPSDSQKEKFTPARRNHKNETPGIFVKDITAGEEWYAGNEYSYCLAEVVNKGWMNGYPTGTSPLCPGRFCGANTLVFGEFVQALINILDQQDIQIYTIDRQNVTNRMADQPENFTLEDATTVRNARNSCDDEKCSLRGPDELRMFTRYCRYHLEECSVQETRALGVGEYPLVEVNVLVDQGIFSWDEVIDRGRYENVPGNLFSTTLQRLVSEKGCEWKLDYDNDGLINSIDACPTHYDPYQYDQDGDTIGDVCDDDIDGDTIKNEIGVVDDLGYINFPLLDISDDNCFRVPNTDQKDQNKNKIGDACEDVFISHSFSIQAEPLIGTAPMLTLFTPTYSGSISEIERNFGDRSYASSTGTIEHTYLADGKYVVKAIATFEDGGVGVAKVTTHVGLPQDEVGGDSDADAAPDTPFSSDMEVSPRDLFVGEKVRGDISLRGVSSDNITQIIRDRDDGTIHTKNGPSSLSDTNIYTTPGTYRVNATIYLNGTFLINEQTVHVAQKDVCSSNIGRCDLDDDGIVDQCDDDIDGDGWKNLLGIVVGETDLCEFSEEIINPDRLKDQLDRIRGGEDLDNCFISENADQKDTDGDGYGDVCDGSNGGENDGSNGGENDGSNGGENDGSNGGENDGSNGGENDGSNGGENDGSNGGGNGRSDDRDGDGLPDDSDACPDVPESNNGYQGKDGCPEPPSVSMPDKPREPYISAGTCVQCPCQQSNYNAELMPGDRVKAILVDKAGEIVYSHSSPVLIREYK